jgi:precorrin-6B methylase 2
MAMAETAMPVVQWVAAHTPVPKDGELMLDIGGSHGLYAAAICWQNPPLRAEVMELPKVIEAARSASLEFGTTDVVTHIEGDIRNADLTREYSVVFIGNLIHHLHFEQLPSVFEKVWNHLTLGGTIAIWDISETRGEGDLVSSLFSLFFYLTSTGRCHPESQIQTILQKTGFRQFQAIQPDGPSLHTLYVARKLSS